jgi:carboxypeptidase C (cathepsin A)
VYFKRDLGFATNEVYNALNLEVNSAWNHEGMTDVNPAIGEAMRRDPKLRVFWTGGLFDITTPLFAARYALDQAGIPSDRLTGAAFPAGHSVFMEAANRVALSAAVRKFVTR